MFKLMGKVINAILGAQTILIGTYDLQCLPSPGPKVIKLFSCSTTLSTKFILLINVKMPTIVGILAFISRINTQSERLKARNFFTFWCFSFYEQLRLCAQLS